MHRAVSTTLFLEGNVFEEQLLLFDLGSRYKMFVIFFCQQRGLLFLFITAKNSSTFPPSSIIRFLHALSNAVLKIKKKVISYWSYSIWRYMYLQAFQPFRRCLFLSCLNFRQNQPDFQLHHHLHWNCLRVMKHCSPAIEVLLLLMSSTIYFGGCPFHHWLPFFFCQALGKRESGSNATSSTAFNLRLPSLNSVLSVKFRGHSAKLERI